MAPRLARIGALSATDQAAVATLFPNVPFQTARRAPGFGQLRSTAQAASRCRPRVRSAYQLAPIAAAEKAWPGAGAVVLKSGALVRRWRALRTSAEVEQRCDRHRRLKLQV